MSLKFSFEELLEEVPVSEVVAPAEPVVETPAVVEPAVEVPAETPAVVEETKTEEVVPPVEETQVDIAIEEITNEIDHQEEVVDGLTALRTIATKIETPTPVEVALFRVAANMAVAGRNEDAQDIIPSMESKKPIDIKGFDEKIKATKKKIDLLKVELANLEAKKKLG